MLLEFLFCVCSKMNIIQKYIYINTLIHPYWGQFLTDRSVIKVLGDQCHLPTLGGCV